MSNQPNDLGQAYPEDPFGPNPYAPTSATSEMEAVGDDVEAYRRKYLSHEASVKSIGVLYILGAIFLVPMGAFILISALAAGQNVEQRAIVGGIGFLYLALGLLQGYAGLGLRKLDSKARVIAILFSVVGLLGIPIGTLISAYFLYLLLSEKGKIVFSEPYQRVIEQTPHIKYKTSIIVWILLGLLVVLLGVGVLALVFGGVN